MKRFYRKVMLRVLPRMLRASTDSKHRFALRKRYMDILGTVPIPYAADKGDAVVQCGCWRIETVLQWVNTVGPEGRVVLVEADETNCMILEIEKKRRKLENVVIVNKAIYDSPAKLEFLYSDFTPRNKLKSIPTYGTAASIQQNVKVVEADSLDNILASVNIERVNHIHFTISGAELEALDGMNATIKPGLRIFARSTCLHEEDDRPVRERVVKKLEKLGFVTILSRPEADRNMGGNIYAMLQ